VLEKVRRSRVTDRLVAAADVVDDGEGRDRGDRVPEQQNAKVVRVETKLPDTGSLPHEVELFGNRAVLPGFFDLGLRIWDFGP
jgi:hypothetical protein